ncbi:class I SAM-dependent methyltransferase [Nocardioides pelophilus]|uniref:class I SAM-dependent methyltransferase n=1 Tax=Nocardioides pelophilus TaxID=2172019 RepID=UPI001603B379|nr:class I SAM-dependent methyltransferase [Nocardioides pelophilus]
MPDLRAATGSDGLSYAGDLSDRTFEPLDGPTAEVIDLGRISDALHAVTWEIEHAPTYSACGVHIPFLFGLVTLIEPRVFVELGVQAGASFFGACQAVQRQGYGTRCVAVDEWPDDASPAGKLACGEFDDVRRIITDNYAGIAGYLRRDFAKARAHFAPGSIDLLHIAGSHTDAAARNDFTTWLDRMSDRGVVIVHDINEFKQDFGVWRFWREVCQQYPSMELGHGHGLGVLVVGENSPLRLPVEGTDIVPMSPVVNSQLQVFFGGLGHLSWSQAIGSAARREREQILAEEMRALQALQREHRVAREASDRLRVELAGQEARIVQLREQRDRLRLKVGRMSEELDAAQARVIDLESSTSWRITKPLRAIRRPGRRG